MGAADDGLGVDRIVEFRRYPVKVAQKFSCDSAYSFRHSLLLKLEGCEKASPLEITSRLLCGVLGRVVGTGKRPLPSRVCAPDYSGASLLGCRLR